MLETPSARFVGPHACLPVAPFVVRYSHADFDAMQHLAENLRVIRGEPGYGYTRASFEVAEEQIRRATAARWGRE